MATNDDSKFDEHFSALMNALQSALLVAGKHAADTRMATADADAIYYRISEAVTAANALWPRRDGEQS